jgi:hypothetical protein
MGPNDEELLSSESGPLTVRRAQARDFRRQMAAHRFPLRTGHEVSIGTVVANG